VWRFCSDMCFEKMIWRCPWYTYFVYQSLTPAFSLSHQWWNLSMICWSRFSQQVSTLSLRSSRLEIECDTCSTAEPLIYRVSTRFKSFCWGFYRWFNEFSRNIFFICEWHSTCKQCVSLKCIVFLLDLHSSTNIVICSYVLKIQTKKLVDTLDIDGFLIRNNQFCFCSKESSKSNVRLGIRFLLDQPVQLSQL